MRVRWIGSVGRWVLYLRGGPGSGWSVKSRVEGEVRETSRGLYKELVRGIPGNERSSIERQSWVMCEGVAEHHG